VTTRELAIILTRMKQSRRTATSIALAIGLHAAVAVLVSVRLRVPTDAVDDSLVWGDPGALSEQPIAVELALIAIPDPSAPPLAAVLGPGDVASNGHTHPLPHSDIDAPGRRAASLGGGAPGGPEAWTGRNDRQELRARPWNHPNLYRLPRRATSSLRSSIESIARDAAAGWDDRSQWRRSRRRRGQRGPAPPGATGQGAVFDPAAAEPGPEPVLSSVAPAPTATGGAINPGIVHPLSSRGADATEADMRGATLDNVAASEASNQRHPQAFDLTRPSAGGDTQGRGVAGHADANGISRRGRAASDDSAALRADVDRQRGAPITPTYAGRHDPYFRRMYQRLDSLVEFPRDLALALDQGEVIVRFTLRGDGSVQDVTVEKSSGFEKFDRQVTRAVLTAGSFGRVPEAILGARSAITVRAPYSFFNPLIR
jgi:TonB family protein